MPILVAAPEGQRRKISLQKGTSFCSPPSRGQRDDRHRDRHSRASLSLSRRSLPSTCGPRSGLTRRWGVRMVAEVRVVEGERPAFYTVESLARRLAVTTRTVKNMIRDKEIASYRFRGCRRIDKVDVDSFLAEHRDERKAAA